MSPYRIRGESGILHELEDVRLNGDGKISYMLHKPTAAGIENPEVALLQARIKAIDLAGMLAEDAVIEVIVPYVNEEVKKLAAEYGMRIRMKE